MHTEDIENKFTHLAESLNIQFPELDLRFNRDVSTSTARVINGEDNSVFLELDLAASIQDSIFEAIFCVKETLALFDS